MVGVRLKTVLACSWGGDRMTLTTARWHTDRNCLPLWFLDLLTKIKCKLPLSAWILFPLVFSPNLVLSFVFLITLRTSSLFNFCPSFKVQYSFCSSRKASISIQPICPLKCLLCFVCYVHLSLTHMFSLACTYVSSYQPYCKPPEGKGLSFLFLLHLVAFTIPCLVYSK